MNALKPERLQSPGVLEFASGTARAFCGMLWSPAHTFESLSARPAWLGIFLGLAAGHLLVGWLQLPYFHEILLRKLSGVPADRIEHTLSVVRGFVIAGTLASPPMLLLRWVVTSLFLWLSVLMLTHEVPFRRMFSVVAHANVPNFLHAATLLLVVRINGASAYEDPKRLTMPLGLNVFFPDLHLAWTTLLGSVNIFQVWYVCLLIIGVHTASSVSRRAVTAVVLSVWLFFTLLETLLALTLSQIGVAQ